MSAGPGISRWRAAWRSLRRQARARARDGRGIPRQAQLGWTLALVLGAGVAMVAGIVPGTMIGVAGVLAVTAGALRAAREVVDDPLPSPLGFGVASALLGAGGVLAWASPGSPWALLAGALAVIGLFGVTARWLRLRGARRVWLSAEGIVEDREDGRVVFPWSRVAAFELTELAGGPALRVWLTERREHPPFQVLSAAEAAGISPDRLARRRARALQRDFAWAGAHLVLLPRALQRSPEEVFRTFREIAEDPDAVMTLPTALRDPPEVDLAALGVLPPR